MIGPRRPHDSQPEDFDEQDNPAPLRTAIEEVRELIDRTLLAYQGNPRAQRALREQQHRLDEPLRIAVAGKIKAGKSTLINALVGEHLAAADAGECTRVVTWYRHATAPRVTLRPLQGADRQLRIHRGHAGLELDLDGATAEQIEALIVDWPSRGLDVLTLIDTPGIDSNSTAISARTLEVLTPEGQPPNVDGVIYLMRQPHASDVRFLESLGRHLDGRGIVNTVVVLSRADEVEAGRIDALVSARKIAARYAAEPMMRDLTPTVLPVAGLVAETGRTLRQDEFAALTKLAALSKSELDRMMLSADRFCAPDAPVAVDQAERVELLGRLGLFGLRLAVVLLRGGIADATTLADELVRRSGLQQLRALLDVHFTQRTDELKARSALVAIGYLLRTTPGRDTGELARVVERVLTGSHAFRELQVLPMLRAPGAAIPPALAAEAERLLGGHGTGIEQRLGLADDAAPEDPAEEARREQAEAELADIPEEWEYEPEVAAPVETADLRDLTLEALGRWRAMSVNPATDHVGAQIADAVARSCEGMLAELDQIDAA